MEEEYEDDVERGGDIDGAGEGNGNYEDEAAGDVNENGDEAENTRR